jgi:hypothetical protein
MHFSCAALYVAKRCSTDLTCEICLEQMESLRSLRDRRVEARRRANRARVALLVLNGASAEDIRRERRRRRGGDDDDDDEAMRFRVGDARADAFGWGSRNPCVWVLWVLSRPLIAIAWVRRENASPFFLRLSRLVFFLSFLPSCFTAGPGPSDLQRVALVLRARRRARVPALRVARRLRKRRRSERVRARRDWTNNRTLAPSSKLFRGGAVERRTRAATNNESTKNASVF